MNKLISELISATIQIIIFMIIPFIAFVIQNKKVKGFFKNIGLAKTTSKAVYLSIGASLFFLVGVLTLVALNDSIKQAMLNPPSTTGKLREMGFQPTTLLILLVIACLKTSLAEEIFFRGFVAKRLINWLGYFKGNLLQSIIFAAIHFLLFLTVVKAEYGFLIFILAFTGIGAYITCYINEKIGNGSIVPGWIAHGIGNIVSYCVIAFII